MKKRKSFPGFDQAPEKYTWHLLWQPLCAFVFVWLVLYTLFLVSTNGLLWAVGASSLASSAYAVFVAPGSPVARPWSIVGSYMVAMVNGGIMSLIAWCFQLMLTTPNSPANNYIIWTCAALAVSFALIFMVIFDFPHPPASGIALVLVLEVRNLEALAVILIAAVVLALIRTLGNPYLRNLI